jgi:hypothetical protein
MLPTRGAKKYFDCTVDGKTMGDAPGGTAQMVDSAKSGTVDIVRIDAGQLLPDLLLECSAVSQIAALRLRMAGARVSPDILTWLVIASFPRVVRDEE